MAGKMDAKFYGEIRKAKDDTLVPGEEYIVFLVKDDALPAAMEAYRKRCIQLHADAEQLAAVSAVIDRMHAWRKANPDRCKVPDAAGERMLV